MSRPGEDYWWISCEGTVKHCARKTSFCTFLSADCEVVCWEQKRTNHTELIVLCSSCILIFLLALEEFIHPELFWRGWVWLWGAGWGHVDRDNRRALTLRRYTKMGTMFEQRAIWIRRPLASYMAQPLLAQSAVYVLDGRLTSPFMVTACPTRRQLLELWRLSLCRESCAVISCLYADPESKTRGSVNVTI